MDEKQEKMKLESKLKVLRLRNEMRDERWDQFMRYKYEVIIKRDLNMRNERWLLWEINFMNWYFREIRQN